MVTSGGQVRNSPRGDLGGYLKSAQIGPYFCVLHALRRSEGWDVDNITSGDAQRDAPKCASDGPLEGPVESVYIAKILNYNLFYRGFLLWPAA